MALAEQVECGVPGRLARGPRSKAESTFGRLRNAESPGDERVSRDAFEIMPTGNDIAAMPAEMRITPSYLTSHLVEQYLPLP